MRKDNKSKVESRCMQLSAYRFELKSINFLFEGLGIADMAHVAMLMKKGIIPKDIGKSILKKLLVFQKKPLSKMQIDPSKGDIYTNRECFLKEELKDLSHYIHTGRARREATNIAFLIACRERLVNLGISLGFFCKKLLSISRRHKRTYMTDFTYLQHAHPTTLGHYLLGYLYALVRDLNRIRDCCLRINQSPAGAGSVNGSQLPLDRDYLKLLLEFDDIIVHTRDAMWRHDVVIEAALPLITMLTTISRLTEELIIWNTSEFGFIELSPLHVRKSVIMPQKRNPYSLAFIRGLSRNMIGRFVSIITTGQTISGQPDNRIFIYYTFPDCIDDTRGAVELFDEVMSKCNFNKKRLYASALEGFTFATDVTDFLVSRFNIDNRTAYKIVSKTIENLRNSSDGQFTFGSIYTAAKELGIKLPVINDIEFSENLKVDKLIGMRKGIGGASPESVDLMIKSLEEEIKQLLKFFNKRTAELFRERFYRKIRQVAGIL